MRWRSILATACAFGVGAVLHVAAVSKVIDPVQALAWAGSFPAGHMLGKASVAVVVAVELLLAWCLMLGIHQRIAAGCAALLAGLFGIALLGWPPNGPGCPCFGSLSEWGARIPPVFKDVGLLAASLAAWHLSASVEAPAHAAHDQTNG